MLCNPTNLALVLCMLVHRHVLLLSARLLLYSRRLLVRRAFRCRVSDTRTNTLADSLSSEACGLGIEVKSANLLYGSVVVETGRGTAGSLADPTGSHALKWRLSRFFGIWDRLPVRQPLSAHLSCPE